MLGDAGGAQELADRGEELLGQVSVPAGGAWLFGAHAYLAVARVRLGAGDRERAAAIASPLLAAAERSGWRQSLTGAGLLDGLG